MDTLTKIMKAAFTFSVSVTNLLFNTNPLLKGTVVPSLIFTAAYSVHNVYGRF